MSLHSGRTRPRKSAALWEAVAVPAEGSVLAGTAHTEAPPAATRRLYVSVAAKFTLALAFTVAWVGLSVWNSRGWIHDLIPVTGLVTAWLIVILVAYLPGAIVAFMAASSFSTGSRPCGWRHRRLRWPSSSRRATRSGASARRSPRSAARTTPGPSR